MLPELEEQHGRKLEYVCLKVYETHAIAVKNSSKTEMTLDGWLVKTLENKDKQCLRDRESREFIQREGSHGPRKLISSVLNRYVTGEFTTVKAREKPI